MMRVAVVGRGLIGAAAARHLAKAGYEVVLIGPDEPVDKGSHQGVFGSHYDEARITRKLDANPFWAEVSTASIARYHGIEAEGGVGFLHPVGVLMSGPVESAMVHGIRSVQAGSGTEVAELSRSQMSARFPFLAFPDSAVGFHETEAAGYVNPRKLLIAQSNAAQRYGASIVRLPAQQIVETRKNIRVGIGTEDIEVDQVLVAAGAYTNMLLPRPLDLTVYARTVALLETDEAETARLAEMPPMIYRFRGGRDPYLLPPIPYPDGRTYLKIGGDPVDIEVTSEQDISRWFRSKGNPAVGQYLAEMAQEIIPGLKINARKTDACAVMFTRTGLPYIDRISSRISVATGGCGAGAKCSDELGRLGAEAVLGNIREELKAIFKGQNK